MRIAEHSSPANTMVKGHSSSMPFSPLLVHCKENLGLDIPNVLPSNNTNCKDVSLFLGQFFSQFVIQGLSMVLYFLHKSGHD